MRHGRALQRRYGRGWLSNLFGKRRQPVVSEGTSVGYVRASYPELEALFGPPGEGSSDYKTTAEWKIGRASIYDYKATTAYSESLDVTPEALRQGAVSINWHVIGDAAFLTDLRARLKALRRACAALNHSAR